MGPRASLFALTRGEKERASDGLRLRYAAQYVPLAYRRQPELPARRAQLHGHRTKGRI